MMTIWAMGDCEPMVVEWAASLSDWLDLEVLRQKSEEHYEHIAGMVSEEA